MRWQGFQILPAIPFILVKFDNVALVDFLASAVEEAGELLGMIPTPFQIKSNLIAGRNTSEDSLRRIYESPITEVFAFRMPDPEFY
jgi:hypothetical protein